MTPTLSYVLITPARNEGKYIRYTLDSVVSQTHLPMKWVIVSDGSMDDTDQIVAEYCKNYKWINLVRMPEHRDRHFAAKVHAFNAGFSVVQNLDYDVIGSLDADISFEAGYFEFLINRFAEDPRLGVGGTAFVEEGYQYDYQFTNIHHVSGNCQLFRRECFREIGGYVPIRGGGIDWTAVTTARMKCWHTRTFTDKYFYHHRRMGTGSSGVIQSIFRRGQKDYCLGGHPLWQIFRSIYQMTYPPFIINGICLFAGYYWAFLRQLDRPSSPELIRFHQAEQMDRLRSFYTKLFRRAEIERF